MIRRQQGLTLIEVLVAVAIFAFVAAMAYTGLFSSLNAADTAKTQGDRLSHVQKAMSIMASDFTQAVDRPIRDQYGGEQPAFEMELGELSFTRGGRTNPLKQKRTTMSRISYRFEDQQLIREASSVLDPMGEPETQDAVLLEGITEFRIRLLDQDQQWQDQWPTLVAGGNPPPLPRGVEVTVTLDDLGTIQRLFALPK